MTYSELKGKKFSKAVSFFLVALCFIPFILSIYFLNPAEVGTKGWLYHLNYIFEWGGVFLAFTISFLLILGQKFEDDLLLCTFGLATLFCGLFDFILIFPLLGNHSPHIWPLGKLFSSLLLLSASFFCHFFSKVERREIISIFTFFSVAGLLSTLYILTQGEGAQVYFETSLMRKPYELFSFIISSLAFFSFFSYSSTKTKLLQGILFGFFPRLLALSYTFIFPGFHVEEHDSIIHFLEFLSFAFPMVGIIWSIFDRLNNWRSEFHDVEIIQDALNASSLVSETDATGKITLANDKFCEVSKYSKSELLGQNHRILKSGQHDKKFYLEMWETISSGKIWAGEICNKAKDGSLYWVSSTIYPSRNAENKINKYVSIRTDITQKKKLEEQETFQRKYFEVESSLLKILNRIIDRSHVTRDIKGIYEEFLDDFCHLFNWHSGHVYFVKNDIIKSSGIFKTLVVDQLRLDLKSLEFSVKKECLASKALEKRTSLWEARNDENELFFQECINTSLKLKTCLCIPIFYKDQIISILEFHSLDEKIIEIEFMSALKKVGDEFGVILDRKNLEIEIAKKQEDAKKHAKAKEEFLSNMSHEIRTPMNGIIGMVNLLEKTELTIQQVDMMKTIKNCGENLLTVINDVLDYSKIEGGHFEIKMLDFNMRDMVEEVVASIVHKANLKGIEIGVIIQSSLEGCFRGDTKRIKQILLNFLSNAVKFTEIGQIVIKVSLSSKEGQLHKICFAVIDSGLGISEKNQKVLFNAFSQGDTSTTREFGGTGLGLAISAKLTSLMNGKIWFESKLGKGSSFFLELDLFEGKEENILPEHRHHEHHKEDDMVIQINRKKKTPEEIKILLVEDNKINQKIAIMTLRKMGYECDLAENGVDALICLEKQKYDMIFMDMQMPIMDGITCTKEIRRIYGEKMGPRIVAMTANVLKEDKDACYEAGMDDFISKPISINEISRIFNDLAA